MRTTSYISAAALAAALLSIPQLAQAQLLGVDLGVGGDSGVGVGVSVGGEGNGLVDAGVNVGGDNGVNVDAGVGGDDGLVDAGVGVGGNGGVNVDAGVGGDDGSLVGVGVGAGDSGNQNNVLDIDVGGSSGGQTGPNGGSLIDLDVLDGEPNDGEGRLLDVDIDRNRAAQPEEASAGTALLNADLRLDAIGNEGDRASALLRLIQSPNLADIDLDATIDDRRVSILALSDLLGTETLAALELNLEGEGRAELLDALGESSVLGSILGDQGIDLDDVLAVEVAENGATQVIVLDEVAQVALRGASGDVAATDVADLANLDLDLLSDEELAEVDLDLLPDDQRTTAQIRLLSSDTDLADVDLGDLGDLDVDAFTTEELAAIDLDLLPEALQTQAQIRLLSESGDLADASVDELANINLDLLSREELAEIDLDLLPDALASAIEVRLLGEDGSIADLGIGDLAQVDIGLGGGTGGGDTGTDGGGTGGGDTGGTGGTGTGGTSGTGTGGGANPGSNGGGTGTGGSGTGAGRSSGSAGAGGGRGVNPGVDTGIVGAIGNTARNGVNIAALGCDVGVLALARGQVATPAAIAQAKSLELVRIQGCERSLVDPDAETIRAAIEDNEAISSVLEQTQIPLDQVIGATVQAGILTLFIDPVII